MNYINDRKILYVVPADYDDLIQKGVSNMILDRDEGGFFKSVLTLHPIARTNQKINISESNNIIQFGWKSRIKKLDRLFITKIVGTIVLTLKLIFLPFKLKQINFTVVRATDPYLCGLIGLYISKILNIPLVVSIHSDYDKRYTLDGLKGSFGLLGSRRLGKKLEKFVLKRCNKILPIRSYLSSNYIKDYNILKNKFEVFPHGINLKSYDKTPNIDIYEKFNINRKFKIFNFTGRMSRENYVYDILEIASRISLTNKEFFLMFVGGGKELEKIKNESKDITNIKCVGFQCRDNVINIQKQSYGSICLMGGFSLIEACAGQNPILSYDIEWHSELVKNNYSGFLVDEGDTNTLIKKIKFLLENESVSFRLGQNARRLIEEKHEISKTIMIKQNVYKRLLNE